MRRFSAQPCRVGLRSCIVASSGARITPLTWWWRRCLSRGCDVWHREARFEVVLIGHGPLEAPAWAQSQQGILLDGLPSLPAVLGSICAGSVSLCGLCRVENPSIIHQPKDTVPKLSLGRISGRPKIAAPPPPTLFPNTTPRFTPCHSDVTLLYMSVSESFTWNSELRHT